MKSNTSLLASIYASMLAIVAVTLMTVGAELAPEFKSFLTSVSGHHWTTKSIFTIVIYFGCFAALRAIFSRADDASIERGLFSLLLTAGAGFIIILGFFTGHALHVF